MSDASIAAVVAARDRMFRLYAVAAGLSLFGIFVLLGYSIRLGLLVGPGVESSFGIAVALQFILAALVVHIADRVYREWPFGRKFRPSPLPPISDAAIARFLQAAVFAAAAGAVVYIFWGLLAA